MNYSRWDKVSPIYDVTAEQAKTNNPLFATEDAYLFYRDNGSIFDIVPVSLLPAGDTVQARCEAFIASFEPPVPTPDPSLEERTAALEAAMLAIMEGGNS